MNNTINDLIYIDVFLKERMNYIYIIKVMRLKIVLLL